MEENKPCPKCGAYNGEHSPRCPLIDFESAKKQLEQYYQLWLDREKIKYEYMNRYSGWVRKAMKEAEFWKGKFNTVKIENNTLRKKVSKQRRKDEDKRLA